MVKKCDRCGRLFDRGGGGSYFVGNAMKMDLCSDCRDELDAWAKGAKAVPVEGSDDQVEETADETPHFQCPFANGGWC